MGGLARVLLVFIAFFLVTAESIEAPNGQARESSEMDQYTLDDGAVAPAGFHTSSDAPGHLATDLGHGLPALDLVIVLLAPGLRRRPAASQPLSSRASVPRTDPRAPPPFLSA